MSFVAADVKAIEDGVHVAPSAIYAPSSNNVMGSHGCGGDRVSYSVAFLDRGAATRAAMTAPKELARTDALLTSAESIHGSA